MRSLGSRYSGLAFAVDGPNHGAMTAILSNWWNARDAETIADKLTEIALDLGSPGMNEKLRVATANKNKTIAQGERAVRSWTESAAKPRKS